MIDQLESAIAIFKDFKKQSAKTKIKIIIFIMGLLSLLGYGWMVFSPSDPPDKDVAALAADGADMIVDKLYEIKRAGQINKGSSLALLPVLDDKGEVMYDSIVKKVNLSDEFDYKTKSEFSSLFEKISGDHIKTKAEAIETGKKLGCEYVFWGVLEKCSIRRNTRHLIFKGTLLSVYSKSEVQPVNIEINDDKKISSQVALSDDAITKIAQHQGTTVVINNGVKSDAEVKLDEQKFKAEQEEKKRLREEKLRKEAEAKAERQRQLAERKRKEKLRKEADEKLKRANLKKVNELLKQADNFARSNQLKKSFEVLAEAKLNSEFNKDLVSYKNYKISLRAILIKIPAGVTAEYSTEVFGSGRDKLVAKRNAEVEGLLELLDPALSKMPETKFKKFLLAGLKNNYSKFVLGIGAEEISKGHFNDNDKYVSEYKIKYNSAKLPKVWQEVVDNFMKKI